MTDLSAEVSAQILRTLITANVIERAAIREAFDALALAGFIEKSALEIS